MPDITKCLNHICPLKQYCFRYNAEPSFMQSYSVFEYIKETGCAHFWQDESKNEAPEILVKPKK